MSRDFDLVVYGATGDAGQVVCHHLANKQRGEPIRWAVAGRNRSKLDALVAKLGGTSTPSVVIAESGDAASLLRMAQSTAVVLTTAGPYLKLGEPVVAACIEAGTHYADITGEVHWVAEMEKKYGGRAAERRVCLASFCGYDCIPDEVSLFAARSALQLPPNRKELLSVESVISGSADGADGAPSGTMATMLACIGVGRISRFSRGWAAYVGPAQLRPALRSLLSSAAIGWSPQVGSFTMCHFMAWCNVPIIHKAYGADGPLRFQDRMALPFKPAWWNLWHLLPILAIYATVSAVLPLVFLLASLPPARKYAENCLASYSYGGNAKASFFVKTRARAGHLSAHVTFSCPGDPGIYATALMAAEASLAMVAASKGETLRAGFTTPVAALGQALVEQLTAAGCKLEATVDGTPDKKTD